MRLACSNSTLLLKGGELFNMVSFFPNTTNVYWARLLLKESEGGTNCSSSFVDRKMVPVSLPYLKNGLSS
jgi:hypothetical protein